MLQTESQAPEMSALMRALAERPQDLERGMRLLDQGFRLTPELFVDLWLQDASARPVIALGEGSAGDAALLGRAWFVAAEVRRMRSLLERLFQPAGVTFERPPRVLLVASRFTDALLGAREELSTMSIELFEARLLSEEGKHRLVVVRAGGEPRRDAPPASDSPVDPLIERRARRGKAGVNGVNGNATHGNEPAYSNGTPARALATRPPAAVAAVDPDVDLAGELKRKILRISDEIEVAVAGSSTRFLFHDETLVALELDGTTLTARLGDGDDSPRPLQDRGALHAIVDEVVRLYFTRNRQRASALRSTQTTAAR